MNVRKLITTLGFKVDDRKLKDFNRTIDETKRKLSTVKAKMSSNHQLSALDAYRRELRSLSVTERADVERLNAQERADQSIKVKRSSKNQGWKPAISVKDFEREEALNKEKFTNSKQYSKRELDLRKHEAKSKLSREKLRAKEELNIRKQTAREQRKILQDMRASMSRSAYHLHQVGRRLTYLALSLGASFGVAIRSTLQNTLEQKGNFSNRQVAEVERFRHTLEATRETLRDIKDTFVVELLPDFGESLRVYRQWLVVNKALVKQRLHIFTDALTSAFSNMNHAVQTTVKLFDPLISSTIGWKTLISGLIGVGLSAWLFAIARSTALATTAMLALGRAMLANPMTWLVGGLALLTEEIYRTIEGGDTLINRVIKSDAWKSWARRIEQIKKPFIQLYDIVVKIADVISNLTLDSIQQKISDFSSSAVDSVKSKMNDLFSSKQVQQVEIRRKEAKNINLKEYFASRDLREEAKQSLAEHRDYSASKSQRVARSSEASKATSFNQKNHFNIKIETKANTTKEQAQEIVSVVKREIAKANTFENQKMFNAIGAY
jgi:hypothetical protein